MKAFSLAQNSLKLLSFSVNHEILLISTELSVDVITYSCRRLLEYNL